MDIKRSVVLTDEDVDDLNRIVKDSNTLIEDINKFVTKCTGKCSLCKFSNSDFECKFKNDIINLYNTNRLISELKEELGLYYQLTEEEERSSHGN